MLRDKAADEHIDADVLFSGQVFQLARQVLRQLYRRSHNFKYPTRNTFITSSPKWTMTFTAMRPEPGLSNGLDVSLCREAQASSSISALFVVFKEM
jgi:hypothetical protein